MKIKQLILENDDLFESAKNAAISMTVTYGKTLNLLHTQLWHKDQLKANGTGFTISVDSYDDSTSTIDTSLIPQRVNFVDYEFTYNSRQVKPIKYWNIKSPSKIKYYKDDLMALGLNQLFIGQNPNVQYSGDPSDGIYHDTCQIKPKAVEEDFVTSHDMTGWYILSSEYDVEIGNTTIYYENTIQEYEYAPEGNQIVDSISLEDIYRYITTENNYNTLSQLTSRVIYTLEGSNINVRTITYDPENGNILSDTNYDTDTSSYTIPDAGTTESVYLDENNQEQTYTQQTITTVSSFIDTQLVTYLNGFIVETINLNISQTAASFLTIDYVNLTADHGYTQYYQVDFSQLGTVVHTETDIPYTIPTLNSSGGWDSINYQLSLGDETSNIYIFNDGTCIQIHPPYTYAIANGDDMNYTYVNEPAKVMYLPLCYQDDGSLVQNKWDFIDKWDNQYELYVHESNYWYIGAMPVFAFVLSYFLPMLMGYSGSAAALLQVGGTMASLGSTFGIKALQIIGLLISMYGAIQGTVKDKIAEQAILDTAGTATGQQANQFAAMQIAEMSFDEIIAMYFSTGGINSLGQVALSAVDIYNISTMESIKEIKEKETAEEEKSIFGVSDEEDDIPGNDYINKIMKIGDISSF